MHDNKKYGYADYSVIDDVDENEDSHNWNWNDIVNA